MKNRHRGEKPPSGSPRLGGGPNIAEKPRYEVRQVQGAVWRRRRPDLRNEQAKDRRVRSPRFHSSLLALAFSFQGGVAR